MAQIGAQNLRIQRPPNGEEPNYITHDLPQASLAAAGDEEVEIETGISIAEPQILRILGLTPTGLTIATSGAVNNTNGTTSETRSFSLSVNTRGGEFDASDPENIINLDLVYRMLSDGTNMTSYDTNVEVSGPPEGGEIVGTPRLVFRQSNDLETTSISAEAYHVRLGYVFEDVTQGTFMELVEKHADIFLV